MVDDRAGSAAGVAAVAIVLSIPGGRSVEPEGDDRPIMPFRPTPANPAPINVSVRIGKDHGRIRFTVMFS